MNDQKRLMRSRNDRMIGGVCGGLGAYFNIDPTLVRIGFALLVFVGVGSPLLLYLLLWIIMPPEAPAKALIDGRLEEAVIEPAAESVPAPTESVADVVDEAADVVERMEVGEPVAEQ